MAFEITSGRSELRPLCAVGVATTEVSQLEACDPAIGWALGLERLLLVLEAAAYADPNGAAATLTAMTSPEVYVVNRGVEAEGVALYLARKLQAFGLKVELDIQDPLVTVQTSKSQRGCRALVLVMKKLSGVRSD